MAQQHVVRVLVPAVDASELRDELLHAGDLDVREVEIEQPEPGLYRDEGSDRRLHKLVVRGGTRVLVGAAVGALIGALIVLVIPYLQDLMLWTLPVFIGGGAWAGAVVYTSRGVQVDKEPDDMPDRLYEVDTDDTRRERELTIIVGPDRNEVEDLLEARGYLLLDSRDPKLDGG